MTAPTPTDSGGRYAEDYNTVRVPPEEYRRLLAIESAAITLIDGTGGKSRTTEYGECYVPQDGDFERLAGVVENTDVKGLG